MKIILLGYMASGKSVVAKELAKKMKIKSLDLDDYIEEKENLNIKEIFKKYGEIKFRMLENHYLKEILNAKKDIVLAVGGGTPCYANNMELITKEKNSVYLKASIETLFKRLIHEKSKRPLVSAISTNQLKEFIAKHLFERNVFYHKASITVSVDNISVETTIDRIMESLVLDGFKKGC